MRIYSNGEKQTVNRGDVASASLLRKIRIPLQRPRLAHRIWIGDLVDLRAEQKLFDGQLHFFAGQCAWYFGRGEYFIRDMTR